MLYFERWKTILIVAISALGILFTLPNLFAPSQIEGLPNWLQKRMPLGLDLQGGSHLLLQMNEKELRDDMLNTIADDARQALREDRIGYAGLGKTAEEVRVTIRKPEDVDKAFERLKGLARPVSNTIFGDGGYDLLVERGEGNVIIMRSSEVAWTERLNSASSAAIETIRRRIDALGTTEPTIQRQGLDRILVQVPGFKDSSRLKDLLRGTGKMSFHLVHPSMSAAEARATNPPPGYRIVEPAEGEDAELVEDRAVLHGDDLVNAQLGFHQDNNQPIVNFRFNSAGAKRFGLITQQNIGRRFAIILDNKVISAPRIRTAILGGDGYIEGNFTTDSANDLAILMRSGALPVSLQVIQERTVGESLGTDSIEAGEVAVIVAFIAVAGFMIAGYGLFGIFAIVSLIVNVALIIAALSLLQATLTLPGIAGIALTMGVAVDSNVLIFERIREEVRSGKTTILAIEAGFARAYATIIDSNLTGLLGGIILFWLGVGPIRGFAVTLCIGILASMFTAITLSRLMIVEWLRLARPQTVPI